MRKIIHIDMDAFYASVEQRDNPEYRGKPLVVGGPPQGRGGVVAAASYEARKYGIRSAMPSKKALELCPDVLFVYPRFAVYKEASNKIHEIFHRYTDLIEPLSLDEAYLDVTVDKQQIGSAIEIAKLIRHAIKAELSLTASAGVSVNKFVAKIASDLNKPDGLAFIGPSQVEEFMEQLPVEKFYGVGKVTAQKMKNMGLHTGADLKKMSNEELIASFGKVGHFYYNIVRGIDEHQVVAERESKSVGAEDTFPFDLINVEDMHVEIERIAKIVGDRLQRNFLKGRTVTLKIKFSDFKQITRSLSLPTSTDNVDILISTSKQLLDLADLTDKKVRLLGISLSNFHEQKKLPINKSNTQLRLFDY